MAIVYENAYSGKSKLGLGIESIIKKLFKDKTYAGITKDTVSKELSKYISELTKGNVTVTIGAFPYVNAYAQVPLLDNSNPLITRSMTNMTEGLDGDVRYHSFKKKYPDLIGGFDFEKNEFIGWTRELKLELCLGYRCIYPAEGDHDMNPGVATFILLHEFGHLVEKIFGIGTLLQENYILAQANARLMGTTESRKKAKVINQIMEEEGVKDTSGIADVIDAKDQSALYTIVLGKVRGKIRSEMDSYGYDQTGSESLADYFATKNGYAMGALYLANPNQHILQPDDIHFIVKMSVMSGAVALAVGSAAPMLPMIIAGSAFQAIVGFNYDSSAMRYDDTTSRFERVLNGYVESIKSKKASVSNEELIEVKKMIKVLEGLPQDQRGIFQSCYEFINPTGRKNRKARDLQKDLEGLANHKLHVKVREYCR